MNTPTKRPIPFYLVLLFVALIGAMLLVVGVMSGASSWARAPDAIVENRSAHMPVCIHPRQFMIFFSLQQVYR